MSLRAVVVLLLETVLIIMTTGTEIKEFLIACVCVGALLGLSLFSVIWAALVLRFSSLCQKSFCERGKNVTFTLTIKGFLLLPVVCKTTLLTPFKERAKANFPIFSNFALNIFKINRNVDFKINCYHSGNWRVGIKKIKVSDVFGLFELPFFFTTKEQCTDEILVTPKFYFQENSNENIGTIENYSGFSLGNSESGEVFEDNRAYRQGDPLRRINWKQSMKIGKPITRLYEKPKKSRALIAIDYYTLEAYGDCDDIYREAALYIADYFVGYKNEVTVCVLRAENLGLDFTCNDITDLSYLSMDIADIRFKRDKSALTDSPLNDFDFNGKDRLFIISANPHQSLIAAVELMNSQGFSVNVIVPKTAKFTEIEDSQYTTFIENSDEIPKKVGAVLC